MPTRWRVFAIIDFSAHKFPCAHFVWFFVVKHSPFLMSREQEWEGVPGEHREVSKTKRMASSNLITKSESVDTSRYCDELQQNLLSLSAETQLQAMKEIDKTMDKYRKIDNNESTAADQFLANHHHSMRMKTVGELRKQLTFIKKQFDLNGWLPGNPGDWSARPQDWPDDVPFLDPNNGKPNENIGKPNKEALLLMYREFCRRIINNPDASMKMLGIKEDAQSYTCQQKMGGLPPSCVEPTEVPGNQAKGDGVDLTENSAWQENNNTWPVQMDFLIEPTPLLPYEIMAEDNPRNDNEWDLPAAEIPQGEQEAVDTSALINDDELSKICML